MKQSSIPTIGALILGIAVCLTSCKPAAEPGGKPAPESGGVVELSCNENVRLSSYADYETSVIQAGGKIAVFLAGPSVFELAVDRDGSEKTFTYLYLPEDGLHIKLRVDGDLLYVNDLTRAVSVGEDDESFASWSATAGDEVVQSIRCISSYGEIQEELLSLRAKNPFIAILTNQDLAINLALPSTPQLLFIGGDSCDAEDVEALGKADLSAIRVLVFGGTNSAVLAALCKKEMPAVARLILSDAKGTGELLKAVPHVQSVTFMGCADLPSSLGGLKNLEELHFMPGDEKLSIDPGSLTNPAGLRALTLKVDKGTTGLDQLANLEYLNPGETEFTEERLASLVGAHPKLRFLDLMPASVPNLKPLQDATQLEAVRLGSFGEGVVPDFTPLQNLEKLRYVGLPEELMNSPEALAALQQACPECVIYQHDGLCLGPGWLALFLPILLSIVIYKRHKAHMQP